MKVYELMTLLGDCKAKAEIRFETNGVVFRDQSLEEIQDDGEFVTLCLLAGEKLI
jgi:hypothetical protein